MLTISASAQAYPEPSASRCSIPAAREARASGLQIGYRIEYGSSTQELVLYRLLRGIDLTALPHDLWELPWWGPGFDEASTDEGKSAHFENLLTPSEVLQSDPARVAAFQAAQLFLQMQGLRSYRPEAYAGDEPADDWWLDEPATSPYRRLDVADWLQSLAASDNLHRVNRFYGRRSYRPLVASWTYFDPRALHSQAYDRVTQHAVERWQSAGDPLWEVVVYARTLPADQLADQLIQRFFALHAAVKSCATTADQYLVYPILRFHTLRLLFTKGLEDDELWDRAIDLFNDSPEPVILREDLPLHNAQIAERVARLYISSRRDHQLRQFMSEAPSDGRPGTRLLAATFAAKSWMFAEKLEDFAAMAQDRRPDEYELWVLNGLSVQALFDLAKSAAFDDELRLRLAKTAWTRAYVLGMRGLDQEILEFLIERDPLSALALQPMQQTSSPERDHLALLVMLRDKQFSAQLEWPYDTNSQWCGRLNPGTYDDVLTDLLGPVLHYGEKPKLDIHINYRSELRRIQDSYRYGAFVQRVGYVGVRIPRLWPDWLSDNVDLQELDALGRLPSAPKYFSHQSVAWARESRGSFDWLRAKFWPEEEGGPGEALHRAIMSTKRDCRRLHHGVYSRKAWIALHDNPMWRHWADRTPYWYDNFKRW